MRPAHPLPGVWGWRVGLDLHSVSAVIASGKRPVPIPNPEAKPDCADGTARGTSWESRTPPDNTSQDGHPGTPRVAVPFHTPRYPVGAFAGTLTPSGTRFRGGRLSH